MNALKLFVAAVCSVPIFGLTQTHANPLVLYNTGVSVANNADGTNGTPHTSTTGNTSVNWTVVTPTSSSGTALTVGTTQVNYTANDGSSAWVNPYGDASTSDPSGDYFYSTTFAIPSGFNPSTASILGEYAVDDQMLDVQLNGVSVFGYPSVTGFGSFSTFTPLAIPVGSNFISGTNTLTLEVYNVAGAVGFTNPSALNVGLLRGTVAVPEPATLTLLASGSVGLLTRRRRSS